MTPGPKGGEEVKGSFCKRAGGTDDVSTEIMGCTFEGGAIPGMPTDRNGLDPAVRVDAGELILEGNTFSNAQKTLLLFQDEANPKSQNGSILANNKFLDSGRARGEDKQVSFVDVNIIGGMVVANSFIIKKPASIPQLKCLEVGFGSGGLTVVRGNTFRVEERVEDSKILAIWMDCKQGKMVADGNVFDGVDAGAAEDPSANFEGKNIKMP